VIYFHVHDHVHVHIHVHVHGHVPIHLHVQDYIFMLQYNNNTNNNIITICLFPSHSNSICIGITEFIKYRRDLEVQMDWAHDIQVISAGFETKNIKVTFH
jgi:hypothetical protein